MKALIFPGQGSQFPGMAKPLFDEHENVREMFAKANEVLGFDIADVMFNGSEEDLKQTKVTQPAIFLHSMAALSANEEIAPDMVAGHSLGEFSALVANGTLNMEDALLLVSKRANAMQKACEQQQSTMAAVLGMENTKVEEICAAIEETVVPANYNTPGQLVISGTFEGIDAAVKQLEEAGARRVVKLVVGGAFHSPLMEPARAELSEAIENVNFQEPKCPIYQNAVAKGVSNPSDIKMNLIAQLTAPVKWAQSVEQMIADGATSFVEIGPGKVLQGMMRKIDRSMEVSGFQ